MTYVPTTPPFPTRTRVYRIDNPSHTGWVRATFNTLTIRVKWDCGWVEDLQWDEIERDYEE